MELLELLARVDFRAALKLVLEITKETVHLDEIADAATWIRNPDAVYARFKITGLHNALVESTAKHALRLLVLEINPNEHSPMFYAVRQALLQCCADRQQLPSPFTRRVNQRIQLKLEIYTQGLLDRDAEQLLNEVATAAMLTEHPDRLELYPSWQDSVGGISALSGTFAVHAIAIAFEARILTDSQLLSVQSVWEDTDVMVDRIQFNPADERVSPAITTKFVRSMLATKSKGTESSGLDLSVGCGMYAFGAACSTLWTSRGHRYVSFHADDRLCWAWIAYAISSCDAAHKIPHVRIDAMTLTEECVDVFERVAKANDPLTVVWKCLNGQLGQSQDGPAIGIRAVVDIGPRATLLLPRERGILQSGDQVDTLRVVDDSVDKPHVCRLYPGAGLCWVHRSAIIRRREIDPKSASRSRILSLDLELYGDTDIQVLTRLLPLIGTRKLQGLEISGVRGLFLDDAAWISCLSR